MITALDSSVLFDVFFTRAPQHAASLEALRAACNAGAIIVSDIVYAELAPRFNDRSTLDAALRDIHARLSPIDSNIAWMAGLRWTQFRRARGPRTGILADSLIGAHALASADAFLTRDRGFCGTYFPELSTRAETS